MKKDSLGSQTFFELNFDIQDRTKYISQNNYKEKMISEVEPYLQKNLECGYILGQNNVKLYYEKFIVKNPKASIVICHGLGEITEKYYELSYYFMKEEYSVFIIEHRGHGRSQRLGIDNSQVNVEKFDYYVEDFKKFIDEIVIPNSENKNLLLFAHSMGGAIGTVFLEKYINYFKAAILSSPMHEINTGRVPSKIANIISLSMKICGNEKKYLPGQIPYTEERAFHSSGTSCKERYEYLYEKVKNKNTYQSGGSSALWYLECLKATKNLIKKENAAKVEIPVLLFQAEHDTYVIPKAQNTFGSYAKNCKIIRVKGAKHEPYFESDEIVFPFIEKVLSFYADNYKSL
jgi:lysophospholipase